MRLTVLTENTVCREGLIPEHGVSFYIEAAGHRILFDMGQSDLFATHAKALGVPLQAVDVAILSHGHYDHGGGMAHFLQINEHAPIYVSAHAFEPHYRADGTDIGLDRRLLASPRIIPVEDRLEIGDGLELLSCNWLARPYGTDSAGLCMEGMSPEDFRHEQYLLIREGERRILVSGCSHKGIENIVEWFRPDVLVGGFHLNKYATDGEHAAPLEGIAAHLMRTPTHYYTCHCTGVPQYAFLKERMGEQISYLACGATVQI